VGAVWMGLEHGGLWRRSKTGFQHFGSAEGVPGRSINALYTDTDGRIWVGSSVAGVSLIDQPGSTHPTFRSYTTREGLSSNEILCITQDLAGRMYLCTARGVDRLEPSTGHVKHYTTADGLAAGELQIAFCDRLGQLWFGTQQGLSRFIPKNSDAARPVQVTFSGIRVEDNALPVSQAGETNFFLPDLSTGSDRVQFDFVGLSFEAGEVLQYQYRLEGADDTWSAYTPHRSVVYAGLHPGHYRFLVRAVNSKGLLSPQPASADFTILAPIWLRWWFLVAVFGSISFVFHLAWRYRARQLVAVQRIRTRIATDLHDDIGSGLSQIAILSEVIRRGSLRNSGSALDQIADVSRELVDSMSDIVWATDPHRDRVGDLAQRMRQFAGEVLGGSDIEFQVLLSGIEEERKLSANVRRQVYLVFKEWVNNVVHHSESTEARVSLDETASSLVLEISDNGKGFDVSQNCPGHGLASMRQRTASLDGNIEWISGVGGTTVKMRVPLHT
jgi:two-component sensor histidine kinase